MKVIQDNYHACMQQIETFNRLYRQSKKNDEVQLLVVSKGQSIASIESIYALGQRHFAESYWQEAKEKIQCLPQDIVWHFLGNLQGNKLKSIASHCSFVHSVCSMSEVEKLNFYRESMTVPLNIFIQMKSYPGSRRRGVEHDQLLPLVARVLQLPCLNLSGLMVMAEKTFPCEMTFQSIDVLLNDLNDFLGLKLGCSMGMSSDYVIAMEQGSTCVRLGSAIFNTQEKLL